MKALHEAVCVFLFPSGHFKQVNILDDRKAWWNWKMLVIKGESSDPSNKESLLVVIHLCDAHSSPQPGKITGSSKDLGHCLSSSSFRVSSHLANLLYFLLDCFDSCRCCLGLHTLI